MESNIYRMGSNGFQKLGEPAADKFHVNQKIKYFGPYMAEDYYAIYKIDNSGMDGRQMLHLIELGQLKTSKVEAAYINPLQEKFGIGFYYDESLTDFPGEEVNAALEQALKLEHQEQVSAELDKQEKRRVREIGRAIIYDNLPAPEPIAVIIANQRENESDSMSDYFGYKTTKVVLLAWSDKKKEDFAEMRKACAACPIPEIAQLATAPKSWEHREKFSGGSGYYLGDSKYSGWIVKKEYFNPANYPEDYAYQAGLDNGFYAFKKQAAEAAQNNGNDITGIEILDYSEKAVAIFGDTKPIKDKLKEIGGRFNGALTHPVTGVRTPGWVFSKKQREELEAVIR